MVHPQKKPKYHQCTFMWEQTTFLLRLLHVNAMCEHHHLLPETLFLKTQMFRVNKALHLLLYDCSEQCRSDVRLPSVLPGRPRRREYHLRLCRILSWFNNEKSLLTGKNIENIRSQRVPFIIKNSFNKFLSCRNYGSLFTLTWQPQPWWVSRRRSHANQKTERNWSSAVFIACSRLKFH